MTIDSNIAASAVPEGFRALDFPDGFIGHNGPVYGRRDGDEVVFGCLVEPHHCNPMGICHGGWLATLVDMVLPIGARHGGDGLAENFLLTVQLSIDYLGSAPVGSWIEGRSQILRQTRRLVFVQGLLTVGGEPIVRSSGIFRIGPPGLRVEI